MGWELRRSLAVVGHVTALGRAELDLVKPSAIRAAIRAIKPAVIVNAAAYTAVDKAESEEELATQVNGVAPGVIAEEARAIGALLLHYSTDYVFDGTKPTTYVEDDVPCPISAYGRSKLAGEAAIAAAGQSWIILRTSWVYAARGKNFVKSMLRLAMQKERLTIVADQVGAPTWSRTIADATAHILMQSQKDGVINRTYHLCSTGWTSWFGFAQAIFDAAVPRLIPRAPLVEAISSQQYPSAAARPRNSRMSTDLFQATFGMVLPPWQEAVDLCLSEMNDASRHELPS